MPLKLIQATVVIWILIHKVKGRCSQNITFDTMSACEGSPCTLDPGCICEGIPSEASKTRCIGRYCGEPKTPGYTFIVDPSRMHYPDGVAAVEPSCRAADGYEGVPDKILVKCLNTGKWETVSGCTLKSCGSAAQQFPNYTIIQESSTVGSIAEVASCALCHGPVPEQTTIQCLGSTSPAQWVKPTGCDNYIFCPESLTGYKFTGFIGEPPRGCRTQAHLDQMCDVQNGYIGQPSKEFILCMPLTGQWDTVSGCNLKDCGPSPAQFEEADKNTFGGIAPFSICPVGYERGDPPVEKSRCTIDGWQPEYACEKIDCGQPSQEGYVFEDVGWNTKYGDNANVSGCAVGYIYEGSEIGNEYATCGTDKKWNGANGCNIVDCQTPVQANYTFGSITTTKYEGEATVSCAKGYIFEPDSSPIPCLATGLWADATGCISLDDYKIGCYKDKANRDLKHHMPRPSDGKMTLEICIGYCKEPPRNYKYAGVQYSKECFCDNDYGSYGKAINQCTATCSGDDTQICGGTWANMVYKTDLDFN